MTLKSPSGHRVTWAALENLEVLGQAGSWFYGPLPLYVFRVESAGTALGNF